MTTQAIVGPLPVVRFRDGAVVPYQRPQSTMDPRWEACAEHRVACDCREAEHAEEVAELRAQIREAEAVVRRVLAGHPTYAYEDGPNGQRLVGCMCTGCQIVRDAHLRASYEGGPSARDEIDGLTGDQVAAGLRWKVCTSAYLKRNPGACDRAMTRRRGVYHEHLTYYSGAAVEELTDEVPF